MLPRHKLLVLLSFLSSSSLADNWSSLGCYKSSSLSNLESKGYYIWQSSGHCEQECSGKRIAALINGSQCYCGDSDPSLDSDDDSNCDTSCQGYGTEKCGGSGYYTVYVNADVDSEDVQLSSSSSLSLTSTSSTSSSSTSSSTSSSSSSSSSSQQQQTSTIKETTTARPSTSSDDETSETSATSSQEPETTIQVASSVQPTTIVSTVINSADTKLQSVIYRTVIESPSSQSSPSTTSSPSSTSTSNTSSQALDASRTASSIPSASSSEASNSNKDKGTSGGVIAGAVVGSVAGVAVIAGLLFAFCWFRRRKQDDDDVDDQFTLSGPKAEMSEVGTPSPPPTLDPNPFLLASGYNYFDTSQQQQFPNGPGRSPSLQQTPRQYNNNTPFHGSSHGGSGNSATGVFGHKPNSSSSGTSGGGGDHSLGSHQDDFAFYDYNNGGDGSLHHNNSLSQPNAPSSSQQQQQQQQPSTHQFQFLNANSPEPEFGRRKLSNGSLPDMIAREPGSLKVVNN